jgi:hypothetical protein
MTSLCWAITPSPNLGFVPLIGKVFQDISVGSMACQACCFENQPCFLESSPLVFGAQSRNERAIWGSPWLDTLHIATTRPGGAIITMSWNKNDPNNVGFSLLSMYEVRSRRLTAAWARLLGEGKGLPMKKQTLLWLCRLPTSYFRRRVCF